jgi:hypothetical protein
MTGETTFTLLMNEVMASADRFGHREHVHLTWLAVRRYGTTRAIRDVSDGIRSTARYAGAPQKFHVTVSRAWVECVGHHVNEYPADDFDAFLCTSPPLLDKRLLLRFYKSTTLAGDTARTTWIRPDQSPFPWES